MAAIKVFTDGASRGNPGKAGIGIVVYDSNDFILVSAKEFIGDATNNQAEYRALIKSTELIKKLMEKGEITFENVEFYSDSELMVNQVNLEYFVKEPELSILNNKFLVKMKKIGIPFTINYIERTKNKAADRLANLAIDRQRS